MEILLEIVQRLRDDLKSNQEQLVAVLNILMHCCKIRGNRTALLKLGALTLLLAFSVDTIEPAEGILLIVESLTIEANESDNINITQNTLTVSNQQRNTEMVARILPYLTYGELAAMEALVQHFDEHELMWRETKRRYFRNRVAVRHLKESFAFTAESGFRFDSFDRSRWDT